MRIVARVVQLLCGLFLIGLGFSSRGFAAAGIFGIFVVGWAIWDLYRETHPDTKKVSDLDKRISGLSKDAKDEPRQGP